MNKIKTWTTQQLIDYGYSAKLLYLNDLVDIWNIIKDNYNFENQYLILPDSVYNEVNSFIFSNNLNKKFTKKWDAYKNNLPMNRGVISQSDYTKMIEEQITAAELRRIKEEEKQKQFEKDYQSDLDTLNILETAHQDTWLNKSWIESTIGTYNNPFAEYYWTIIGKNGYKIKDWKGNIAIREDSYNRIINDHTFKTYSGKKFLTNCFRNKKGYSAYIDSTFVHITADESGYGIYGIYYEKNNSEEPELIYIGMTQKGFQARWQEHMDIFTHRASAPYGMILYQQSLDPSKIFFKKIINVKDLKFEGSISLQELKAMELCCITILQPKYNIVGISKPYIL